MEYVEVRFVRQKVVFVDGEPNGKTNKVLRVGTGTHVFDLGDTEDYEPREIKKVIRGSNPLEPIVIEFQEVTG